MPERYISWVESDQLTDLLKAYEKAGRASRIEVHPAHSNTGEWYVDNEPLTMHVDTA